MIILLVLSGSVASANNVVPVQEELTPRQVEWVNKWRTDENFGVHHNFAWYRTEDGHVWSASINEFNKSGHREFSSFFQERIQMLTNEELEGMNEELGKAVKLLITLSKTMDFEAAYAITSAIFEQLSIDDEGNPTVTSMKYNLTTTYVW